MTDLTAKAERTRQLILDTALDLFAEKGYNSATMREIAAAAGVSLGLAYRYFESKESLVLALYQQMAEDTDAAIADLAPGTIADRFSATMNARLASAAPYRQAFGALFGAIMTPGSGAALLGSNAGEIRQQAEKAFIGLVEASSDSLKLKKSREMGKLLYALHFAVILFWLHDRTEGQRMTATLLSFIHDSLILLRQGMRLPVVGGQISRLSRIIDGVFGASIESPT